MSGIDFLFVILLLSAFGVRIHAAIVHQVWVFFEWHLFCIWFLIFPQNRHIRLILSINFRYRISKSWCESFPEDTCYVFCVVSSYFLFRSMCLALENWLSVRKMFLLAKCWLPLWSLLSIVSNCFVLFFYLVSYACICVVVFPVASHKIHSISAVLVVPMSVYVYYT